MSHQSRLTASAFLIGACFFFMWHSAQAQSPYNREESALLMAGSYLGMADFCATYNVDFRSLAAVVRDGMRQNSLPNRSDPLRIAFDNGVKWGTRGMLFSPQAGDFLNMAASTNMQQVCQQAHQTVVRISQMK
jgi:hypothetical protein